MRIIDRYIIILYYIIINRYNNVSIEIISNKIIKNDVHYKYLNFKLI